MRTTLSPYARVPQVGPEITISHPTSHTQNALDTAARFAAHALGYAAAHEPDSFSARRYLATAAHVLEDPRAYLREAHLALSDASRLAYPPEYREWYAGEAQRAQEAQR